MAKAGKYFCKYHRNSLIQLLYMLFYKHSVFQSEAPISLSFSQIQPQNMLKICLSKNIEKSKFHDLTYGWREGVGRGDQNKEN